MVPSKSLKLKKNCLEVNIPITTIDDFVVKNQISALDVIKIDVEGNELNVLKGANKTLSEQQPLILMEVSDRRTKVFDYKARLLCDILKEHGYQFYVCTGLSKEGFPEITKYTPTEFISYVDVFAVPQRFDVTTLKENQVIFKD